MKINRTANTVRNTVWGMLNNVIGMLLPFFVRTVMLYYLGTEYLGLTSLFTSVLSMLNLAELGFSSAIVYSMYKPISTNNVDEVCALLALYKKVYRVIGVVVLAAGLCTTPFLDLLIKGEYPADINIKAVFLVELLNVAVGYFFFAYKESILQAHQRTDISSKVLIVVRSIKYVIQILILIITHNFYLYIIISPISTVVMNCINYRLTTKQYPQYVCKGKLDKNKVSDIKKQVAGLMISKVCGVTRNGLDNIVLSAFIGLSVVAIYGNYFYILTSVHTMLGVIGVSMRAGVGNSIACESIEKNYADMRKFTFLYAWISGFCTSCCVALYQPFMRIWVGEKNLFSNSVMILFCVYFYLMTMTDVRNVYIDATGIWWQNKKRPVIETIMNLVLNIILGKLFGVIGILLATIISLLIVNIGYGSTVLFNEYFTNKSIKTYFLEHGYYILTVVVSASCTYFLSELIPFEGIGGLFIRGLICILSSNAIFAVFFFKHPMFKHVVPTLKLILKQCKNVKGEG